LLANLDPADKHLPEFAAGFVRRGAEGRCALALGVLGPPPDEGAIFVVDFLGERPRKRSIQPALNRKLFCGLSHLVTITLAIGIRPYPNGLEAPPRCRGPEAGRAHHRCGSGHSSASWTVPAAGAAIRLGHVVMRLL